MTTPREYDAVLGSQNQPPLDAAILGGIEGVKMRLGNGDIELRVAALYQAIKYGDTGLDLVIRALQEDRSWQVRRSAYLCLKNRKEARVKQIFQALEKYNPYSQFSCKYTLSGHLNKVTSVTVSTDGKILASGSDDRTIKVWNLATGKLIYTFSGHRDPVKSISIDSTNGLLASGSDDGTIKLWNLNTGELIHTFTGHSSGVTSVIIDSKSRIIISASLDKTVKVWGLDNKRLLDTITSHWKHVRESKFIVI